MKILTIDRSKEWTVEDYLQLEEMSTPCELLNGELNMSPAPNPIHQEVLSNLNDVLKRAAKKTFGAVYFAPIDLFVDKKNVLQPDLVYISEEKKKIITNRGIEGVPDLVVEILSPSNIFADRYIKKKIYQQIGVKEYWIVDPAHRTLEIYKHDQPDHDTPHLFVAENGEVTSTVLTNLKFDLHVIFNP